MFSRLIIAVAALTITAAPILAQPIVLDDPQFGSGSISGDPAQNLVFLDLTVTEGISLAAIQTGLQPGGTYEGWRYATRGEVAAFINSFGGWFHPISDQTEQYAQTGVVARTILEDFIGITEEVTFFGYDYILGTGYLENGNAIRIQFTGSKDPEESVFFFISPDTKEPPFPLSPPNTGHWLVRDVEAPAPTYQGTLADAGTPVDADADFRVTLVSGFGVMLETIEHTQVPVTDGLFTIPLSFDPTLFETPGAALRIEVRAPSGAGDYETITPDQPISPAPIAVFAQRAGQSETADFATSAASADSANVASTLSNQESRPLTLFAGTEIYGAGYLPPTATRIGNTVTLNGLVRDVGNLSFPTGNTFAILDEGMRPNGRLIFLQASSAGAYRIDVKTDGTLSFQGAPGVGGSIDWVSLDGISFPIE
tara:strand:- start:565 stop:1839 length:1275 start_codon:yes stop_codon:yes gene_type:complete